MVIDQNDADLLALCLWREARGEGDAGMTAVCNVILNRVGKPGFANTLHSVIMNKNQFSSMSIPSDAEYSLHPSAGDIQFAFCQTLAQQAQAGTLKDITLGAHYYDVAGTKNGWFTRVISGPDEMGTPEHPFLVQIRKQRFYK